MVFLAWARYLRHGLGNSSPLALFSQWPFALFSLMPGGRVLPPFDQNLPGPADVDLCGVPG
jgi:hypothetical protein